MALSDREVLFGRLALGKQYLSRAQARELAAGLGPSEPIAQGATRLKLLSPAQVEELEALLARGSLVCRPCGKRLPLSASPPERCACGGTFFLSREAPAPSAALPPPPGTEWSALELVTPAPQGGPDFGTTVRGNPMGQSAPLSGESTVELEGQGGAESTLEMEDPALAATWRGAGSEAVFEPFWVGPFEALTPIGRGGMGTVFRARGPQGELVALKILNQSAAQHEEVLKRFQREIHLSAALNHPNVVKVHQSGVVPSGELEGRPWFAMDFVPGRDLAAWSAERERSFAEVRDLLGVLCQAMDYAHGRGVVHRDLKPGNVLVAREGEVPKICDFGLARYRAETEGLTRTGDIMGTPAYMPPEQALGQRERIGPPTDVYALGAILYFLLVGRPPFSGPGSFAVIDKVVKTPPTPPSELNPRVPAELEQVVLKTLAKDPVERFHTCGEFGRALAALAL